MKLRPMVGAVLAGVLAIGLSVTVAAPAHAGQAPAAPGSYQVVPPTRVLDTRSGIGAPEKSVAPLSTVTFTIPDELSATIGSVLLEVTVVNPTAAGYATVFSPSGPRPVVSNINFAAGQNVPNTVVVRLAGNYQVSIFNGSSGTVDLLADVQGYFQSGTNPGVAGTFIPVTPKRYLDTRSGLGAVKAKAAPHSVTSLQVTGGVVPTGASAVAVNVTAVAGDGPGFLTVYPADDDRPEVSAVNYVAGQNRANLVLSAVTEDGTISIYNGSSTAVDLLADVTGYFGAYVGPAQTVVAGAFIPALLGRAIDTRRLGTGSGYVPSLATLRVPLFDPSTESGAAIIAQIKALAVNVTSVNPQAAGFFTTWDGSTTVPAVSNVNFQAKRTAAGSIVVPLNDDGTISIYNGSFGSVDMLVDVTGLFSRVDLAPNRATAVARSALGVSQQPTVIRNR